MTQLITNLEELDKFLPLIYNSKEEIGADYSISAYIAWVVLNLKLPTFRMWGVYEGEPVGFIMATIEPRYFQNECVVITAYFEQCQEEDTREINQQVNQFAKLHNCKRVGCFSDRKGLIKKYGFHNSKMYLTREVV